MWAWVVGDVQAVRCVEANYRPNVRAQREFADFGRRWGPLDHERVRSLFLEHPH